MKSPFIPYYPNSVGSITRQKFVTGQAPISGFSYTSPPYDPAETLWKTTIDEWRIGANHGKIINSIEEAEDEIINKISKSYSTYNHPKDSRYADPAFAVLINRQANHIAARTRIGAGNVLLSAETGISILQSATTTAFAYEEKEVIGRWKYVGTLNNSMKVYLGSHLPKDIVYIVGNFSTPGHANIVEHKNAMYLITEPPFSENYVPSHDFYGSVKIEYCD